VSGELRRKKVKNPCTGSPGKNSRESDILSKRIKVRPALKCEGLQSDNTTQKEGEEGGLKGGDAQKCKVKRRGFGVTRRGKGTGGCGGKTGEKKGRTQIRP